MTEVHNNNCNCNRSNGHSLSDTSWSLCNVEITTS